MPRIPGEKPAADLHVYVEIPRKTPQGGKLESVAEKAGIIKRAADWASEKILGKSKKIVKAATAGTTEKVRSLSENFRISQKSPFGAAYFEVALKAYEKAVAEDAKQGDAVSRNTARLLKDKAFKEKADRLFDPEKSAFIKIVRLSEFADQESQLEALFILGGGNAAAFLEEAGRIDVDKVVNNSVKRFLETLREFISDLKKIGSR